MTDEQFDELTQLLTRIAVALERQNENPAASQPQDTFGIRPGALYTDEEVQTMFSCSDKTTRKWRNEYGLKFHQRNSGKKGSRIWYCGQDLIDFFRKYAVELNINYPKPIEKNVPKGHC